MKALSAGAAQLNISQSKICSFKIKDAPIKQQEAFVNFINQIDKSKFILQQMIEKLELLKKSRFIEMFDQYKSDYIHKYVDISRGASPRPINSYLTKDEDGVNWIKIGDVSEESLYITETREKITKEGALQSRYVYKGDFILSNSMSYGRPYILGIDGCVHDGWLVLSNFSDTFDNIYLYYALRSDFVNQQFKSKVNGATVKNLNSDLVKNTKIKVPPKDIQIEFANFIQQVDKSKLVLQKALENLVGKV